MTTNKFTQDNPILNSYLYELTDEDAAPKPETETWEAMMQRISHESAASEIDEQTYFSFLDVLPPRFVKGSCFCFAEGIEPFRLFWKRNSRYLVRFLDWQQTTCLCHLAGIPVYE